MNAFPFLSNPVTEALGWTLLHALWQGFLLVLPVAVLLHLLRSQSSYLRYRVGVLSLLAQLLVSAGTFIWYYTPSPSSTPLPARLLTQQVLLTHLQTVSQTLPWQVQVQRFLETHLTQFVLVYLIGVALFGLRLAGGWLYLQRLTQTAIRPATQLCLQLTDRLRSTLAITPVVRVLESAQIAVPMVVGVLKPVLLLPMGLVAHLTPREIEAILAHELAHIKRHDYAVNLLQSVVEVLYFFHPALWWLSARIREEREHCCDDLAVALCGGNGRILAQALARVEELRLAQTAYQTPALAMALATNRHKLLHRVRRVLGVQTRPFVSNSSLAGLTLATLLLLSVSVYAVQKQQQPKPKASKLHSSRRHTTGDGTEFGLTDGKKVDYVIWKGHKLSTKQVTRLQHQLDEVMAGRLSLDTVPQADRDILLTIIETNHSFDKGMDGLAEGLSHIDYSNIVASALNNVPLSPGGTVEGLAKVDYQRIVKDAMASVPAALQSLDTLRKMRSSQQNMDSLSQLIAQRAQKMEALQLQMEKMRFPIEEFERNQELLEWKKQRTLEQRMQILQKRQQMLASGGKNKLDPEAIEKQLEQLEPEIKKHEQAVEELNRQLEQMHEKLRSAQLPLEKLERESEELDEDVRKLSNELDRNEEIKLDLKLDNDAMINYKVRSDRSSRNGDARSYGGRGTINVSGTADVAPRVPALPRSPRPPRPAPAPAATTIHGHVSVDAPAAPAIAPAPNIRATPKPVKAPKAAVEPDND